MTPDLARDAHTLLSNATMTIRGADAPRVSQILYALQQEAEAAPAPAAPAED